ncbi:MAG: urease accessory UreF family protein [Actinomycetota bacterium]
MNDLDVVMMVLADGRLPTGGHTHSAGVEAAVQVGDVIDLATTDRFLAGRLATTGLVDAAFAAAAAGGHDLADLDTEYEVRTLSPHLRTTSRSLGRQLHRAGLALLGDRADVLRRTRGCHRAIVMGALVADVGGAPLDAARLELHHLASAVHGAAVKLLALDPLAVAAAQLRATDQIAALAERAADAASTARRPSDLPAAGGTLTEILGEWHGGSTQRMFVA